MVGHSENSLYASHDDCCILAKHSSTFIEMGQFTTYAYKFLKSSATAKLKEMAKYISAGRTNFKNFKINSTS